MSENIFDKRRLKTFSSCKDLVKSMVGTRDGVIFYNENFRLDLENTCYKASVCEDLQQEKNQLQNNWNELKNWLKQQYKLNDLIYYNDRPVTNPKKARIEHISKREELKEILDKMQELEDSVCEK